jgi:hypothetical protein
MYHLARRALARLLQRLSRTASGAAHWIGRTSASDDALMIDEYVSGVPTAQKAVDILPGWSHALPQHVGAKAGVTILYRDPRILWAIEQFGSLAGRKILELGPLEASHTYILDQLNPELLHAIEAKAAAYLRCLVVKELLNLRHARFFVGDFIAWLETTDTHYDLIVASGVLYHMMDPLRLLELISQHCDNFYLWTHYFDAAAMPPQDPRRSAFVNSPHQTSFRGELITLHERSYLGAWQKTSAFCGGMYDQHFWLEQNDIIKAIRLLGFDDIRIAHDHKSHQNGPCFSVFARRQSPSRA